MKCRLILGTILLIVPSACSVKELEESQSEVISKEMVFTAEFGDSKTKTAFQSDETSIWWSPNDEISIFYGASEGNKFTSTNDTEVAKAEFRGTLNAFTGETETGDFNYFWAVYPYSAAVSCDGSSVVANLSNQQIGKAGSFAPNTNITIAKNLGLALSFYNACAWFRFSVKKEGVKRVVFKGNNNEDVAGEFQISIGDDGRPTAPTVINGEKEITLTLPEEASFEVGKMYFITLFPQIFEGGFTVTFETDDEIGSRSITAKATYLRSKYNTGVDFDKNVVYQSTKPQNNEIWYTSQDGNVINPNTTYFVESNIVSNTVENGIGKIVFVADMTSIPSLFFKGKPYTSITLPSSVSSIGEKVFYECNYLENVDLPNVSNIANYNFYKCPKLKQITLPSTLTSLGVNCFYECSSLEEATINTSASIDFRGLAYFFNGATLKKLKGPWATENGKYVIIDNKLVMAAGKGLENAIIPEGVTEIKPYVFSRYTTLKNVVIPGTVTAIGESSFYGCNRLENITIYATTPPAGSSKPFEETNECPIIVPTSSVSDYKTAWVSYSVRIGASLDDIPILLSKGGRANCYIVNSAGQYRFIANKLGNSNEEINYITNGAPTSVEVLWESSIINPSDYYYQTSHEPGLLISSISFENDEIVFSSTGNEGNALVALKNASGTIMWSWHLWFVNEEIEEVASSSLMDRNLGAIRKNYLYSNYNGRRESLSYGLLYQKGRKDPFVGIDSALWDYEMSTTNMTTAVRNPTKIYGTNNGTWNNYPFGWNTYKKNMNDPCPPGWRIPSMSDLSGTWRILAYDSSFPISSMAEIDEIDDYCYDGSIFPCAGNIQVSGSGDAFKYVPYRSWSSDDDGGYENYGRYYFADGFISMESGYNCTFSFLPTYFSNNNDYSRAFSIRCCKE